MGGTRRFVSPPKSRGVAGWKSSPQRFGCGFFSLQFGRFSLQKLLSVGINPRVRIWWKLFSRRQTQSPAFPWSGFLFPDSELTHLPFSPEFQLLSFAPAVCQAADFEAQRQPRLCSSLKTNQTLEQQEKKSPGILKMPKTLP